jgi:thiaminase/transcriptional activator TenA
VARMEEAYLTSLRYEYLFWDMAYRQEEWPL